MPDSKHPQRHPCHCGRVCFEVDAPAVLEVSDCNCSLWSRLGGYLHLIVPRDKFRLLVGEDVITTYTFNTGIARHTFCSVCGIKAFYTPRSHPNGIRVSTRCLDRGTVHRLGVQPFDGWRD